MAVVCDVSVTAAAGGGPKPIGLGVKVGWGVAFADSIIDLYVADSSGCGAFVAGAAAVDSRVDCESVDGVNALNGSGSSIFAGAKEREGVGGAVALTGEAASTSWSTSSSSSSSSSSSTSMTCAAGVAEPPWRPLTSSRVVNLLPEPLSCSSFCAAPRLAVMELRNEFLKAEPERRSDSLAPIFSGRAIFSYGLT